MVAPPTVDATLATTEATDPTDCDAYVSVWFEFTPTDNVDITVETSGYQTQISVWTGAPDALTLVGCDGGVLGPRFQLTGGQRYWIMISSPYPPPIGGRLLSLTIRETNEILAVDIHPTNTVTAEGTATVTGSVTCSSSGLMYVEVVLSQTFKRPPGTVAALSSTVVECDGAASWSLQLTPGPVGFAKGDAKADVRAASLDTFTNLLESQQVKLN